MKILHLLYVSLLFFNAPAQFTIDWTKNFDLSFINHQNLDLDQQGNSYLMINYTPRNGEKLLDHTFQSKYNTEAASLVKLDTAGKILWHQTMTTEAEEYNQFIWSYIHYQDIAVSPDGETIAVWGLATGKVNLTSGNNKIKHGNYPQKSGEEEQHFILIYDKNGKLLKEIGIDGKTGYDSQLNKIKIDHQGNIYLILAYENEITINGEKITSKHQDIETIGLIKFHHKTHKANEIISWKQHSLLHHEIDEHHYLQSIEIDFDKEDNIYLRGLYIGHVTLSENVTLESTQRYVDFKAGFLVKYSPQMDLEWNYKFGGTTGGGTVENLIFGEDNEVYFSGNFTTNIIISGNQQIITKTETPTTTHSGQGMFYGKIDKLGKLTFVKYHKQEKHFTNCRSSLMWMDQSENIHIMGVFNDSLHFKGLENTLFGGMRVDTNTTSYQGKELRYTHTYYLFGVHHTTFKEDKILSAHKVFDMIQPIGHNFFINPKMINNSILFTATGKLNVELGDQSIKNEDRGTILVKLHFKDTLPGYVVSSTKPDTVENFNPLIDTSIVASKLVVDSTVTDSIPTPNVLIHELARASAYPNPFVEIFSVKIENCPQQFEVNLYNNLGQLITSQMHHSDGSEYNFSVSSQYLPNGVYFLLLSGPEFHQTIKLIKSD